MKRVLVISANLGDIDSNINRELLYENTNEYSFEICFLSDSNFLPRVRSMLPRLQAKIPKMLAYEVYPGYDYYIWIDGNFTTKDKDSFKLMVDNCGNNDFAFFRHPHRETVGDEFDFMFHHLPGNSYLKARYENEFLEEQYNIYMRYGKEFRDQPLYACGAFVYNKSAFLKPDINLLKEWFYHNCRYSVQDQLSLPYLLMLYKTQYKIGILKGDIVGSNDYLIYLGGH